ncbi:nuclear transport factor 2 family protein [Streptomyces tritici]|uniref:nuclear transport factor 2 family protein n=1 Tax=Streptomyces tritici TaxID=2054410 RepID=UPI003AF073BC
MTETTVRNQDFAQLVEQYVSFWNTDPKDDQHPQPAQYQQHDQHEHAAAIFTDEVEYRAHIGVLTGPQALIDFHQQFTGHMGTVEFRLREHPQAHHSRARLPWEILTGDGSTFATGTDILHLDENGRISSVTVFLDQAPEGFDPDAHA